MAITDEKRLALLRKCVRRLREDGYSYEEIPYHLEGPAQPRLEPWEIYAAANPGKSAAQVAAWKARHYPDTAKGDRGGLRTGIYPATFTTR